MDTPLITLDTNRIRLEPGGQERVPVSVRNPGHHAEVLRLDLVGLEHGWWEVQPPELDLGPGEEATALVVIQPPANAPLTDDPMPFGVRARSSQTVRCSAVEEGDLEIGRVLDLQAVMKPVTSSGRWWTSHRITYTNWGDTDARIQVSAEGSDEHLDFRLRPQELVVPVGGSAVTLLRIRLRRLTLRGMSAWHPFRVVQRSASLSPSTGSSVVHGAFEQVPVLFRGFTALAGIVVVLMMFGVGGAIVSDLTKDPDKTTLPPVPPDAPTVERDAGRATVTWTPVDGATGYEVWRQVAGQQRKLVRPAKATSGYRHRDSRPACYSVVAVAGDAGDGGLPSAPSAPGCLE
ncbi:hypothetical protein KIH74_04700 [Kineosporia sp. J2-2]|uniref:Fibronectin type-III domain-containing protein n=1 Tax=Kineosporia corallincola TaxID=2835133 RepID=A0ABS5TCR1_9ACTN|nr:hypothetical protein [Kineosporia corallincola]MBT0768209.1 hypothetical protein [Kineosporia corallincola]